MIEGVAPPSRHQKQSTLVRTPESCLGIYNVNQGPQTYRKLDIMGCIYLIRNLKNGKCYIGKTVNYEKRIKEHLNCDPKGSRLLTRAIKKYGREFFASEILHDGIIPELLDSYEIDAIKTYNTLTPAGYNLTTGGEGGNFSTDTLQKMSDSQKKRMSNPQNRQRISEKLKGRTLSAKTRQKISVARKNNYVDTNRKLSAYDGAYEFFFSLPDTLSIKEKRRLLIQKFPNVKHGTIRMWVRKWIPSQSQRSERESAFKYLSSLPFDMPIKEKRKLLRKKYPDCDRKTIYNWLRKWQSDFLDKK